MRAGEYAKLIFNCNELPIDVEHTNAYFRRFIIIPFEVTIPPEEQDKQLHTKIIENELSGVFNWVINGLKRLLLQKQFTRCKAVERAVELYKTESDSARMFIIENHEICPNNEVTIKELYEEYRNFCFEDGYKRLSKRNFNRRIESQGVLIERSSGNRLTTSLKRIQ